MSLICELCKPNNPYSLMENIFENLLSYLKVTQKEKHHILFFSCTQKQLLRCVIGGRYSADLATNLQKNTHRDAPIQ